MECPASNNSNDEKDIRYLRASQQARRTAWLARVQDETRIKNDLGAILPYLYNTLETPDHIRLLVLLPSQDSSSEIRCVLRHILLQDAVELEYEAISYAWGSPIFDHRIEVGQSYQNITLSLHTALRRFRFEDRPRILWADALCINQHDIDEKQDQLNHMASIFRLAAQVVVWLGEDDDENAETVFQDARRVFDKRLGFPAEIQKGFELPGEPIEDKTQPAAALIRQNEAMMIEMINGKNSKDLGSICRKSWFRRIWTIQEIALASKATVYCGQQSIAWTALQFLMTLNMFYIAGQQPRKDVNLESFSYCADIYHANIVVVFRELRMLLLPWETPKHPGNLLERKGLSFLWMAIYASMARGRGCNEDRDRIFALLSMQPLSPSQLGLGIDYRKPVEQSYAEFTCQGLKVGVLSLLRLAGLWYRQPASSSEYLTYTESCLPSWAAEFRLTKLPLYTGYLQHVENDTGPPWSPFSSSRLLMTKFYPIVAGDSTRVLLSGTIVGQASSVVSGEAGHIEDDLEWIYRCSDMLATVNSEMADDTTQDLLFLSDALAATCVASGGILVEDFGGVYRHQMVGRPTESLKDLILMTADGFTEDREAWYNAFLYMSVAKDVHNECAFFVTENGLMGLAAPMTKAGDIVVWFDGLLWPFTLRPVPDSDDYQLVGECYLHGYMDGERHPDELSRLFSLV